MGTTAQKLQNVLDAKADIKAAIEERGVAVPDTFIDYGNTIRQIEIAEEITDEDEEVLFIDSDARLLYTYTLAEALALEEMPKLPTKPGMTNQGWNYTLAEMKEQLNWCGYCVIGCNYITDDNKTYIDIEIVDEEYATFPLHFAQTAENGVTVDWGDGSATETYSSTSEATHTHTYTPASYPAKYTITLTPGTGVPDFYTSYNICGFSNNNSSNPATAVSQQITAVRFGTIASNLQNTFKYCMNLSEVNIPNCVTRIGSYAFSGISAIRGFIFPRSVTRVDTAALSYCWQARYASLPMSVTTLGEQTFRCSCSIRRTNITSHLTSVNPTRTFDSCNTLKQTIKFPTTLTRLGDSMYSQANSMTEIDIPSTVTTIGNSTFKECYLLKKLVFPASLTSISSRAFYQCYGLTTFDFSACTSIPTLQNVNAFELTPNVKKIIVPDDLYDEWISASNWSSSTNNVVGSIIKASEA